MEVSKDDSDSTMVDASAVSTSSSSSTSTKATVSEGADGAAPVSRSKRRRICADDDDNPRASSSTSASTASTSSSSASSKKITDATLIDDDDDGDGDKMIDDKGESSTSSSASSASSFADRFKLLKGEEKKVATRKWLLELSRGSALDYCLDKREDKWKRAALVKKINAEDGQIVLHVTGKGRTTHLLEEGVDIYAPFATKTCS